MSFNNDNLIWIDLEMTGLDPANDRIIEIATVVTDKDLNVLAEGPMLAIHESKDVLDNMHEWCVNTHGASGLTKRVLESTIDVAEAERQTIEFLKQYVAKGKSPMCGNTICQDRRFMVETMPELEQYFHYRHIDVSTIKELIKRWRKDLLSGHVKQGAHLALDDVMESIDELKYYREHFLIAEKP
jgi:oligoribonuclease